MTTVATIAEQTPDKTALIYGDNEFTETYGELELRSRRIAHALRGIGLEPGDSIAALISNDNDFFDIFWAAHRIGLYFTPINWHLQEEEILYIVDNCDAKVLFANASFGEVATRVAGRLPRLLQNISTEGEIEGYRRLEEIVAEVPEDAPLEKQLEGTIMLYSSGTTGRPKGVRRPLPQKPPGDPSMVATTIGLTALFGIGPEDRYLSPAPLYHAAPLAFTSAQHRLGSTAIVMRRFDPELALHLIDRFGVTASQWVPTHFRRLLRLPDDVRERYDVSSLRVAVHAAAPCPVPLKQAMIEWWGDAIVEYYAGTEGGGTLIRAADWLTHKGSVGRHWAGKSVHILDEDGSPIQEPGREGAIYFEAPAVQTERFQYHKDDEKTRGSYRDDLFTIGDIGYLDEEGFLYLTDRQSNMIISGGANIYPQETENHLIMHPKVDDVAVIGVPNEDMGEEVKAVVVPSPGIEPGEALERELIEFCRAEIAHYKCPRSVDFTTELPRTETGKMAKRKLRDRYWEGHEGTIG